MNIYKLLNYPDYSRDFLNIEIQYGDLLILVTGFIDITMRNYYVRYDGNLISGGYMETELDYIRLNIYDIKIYDDEGNKLISELLKNTIINEIKNQTYV